MYPTKLKAKYKGILLIVSAAFCFACMAAFVRLSGDLPTFQKSFFRNFIALIVATAILVREGEGFRPASRQNWPFLLARAAFGTAGLLMNFYAVDHLLLADATMLNKMSPFFAVIASYFILKENISPVQGLSLVGAFVGALFIVKPSFSNMDLGASLIGLLGGLGAGLAYTFVRLLGKKGERKSEHVLKVGDDLLINGVVTELLGEIRGLQVLIVVRNISPKLPQDVVIERLEHGGLCLVESLGLIAHPWNIVHILQDHAATVDS